MKTLFLILLLLPFPAQAAKLSEVYWTMGGACSGYVYHFDSATGQYQIYTRMKVRDKKHGQYYSYQYTEGKMTHRGGARDALTGEGMQGSNVIDFSNMKRAVITSSTYGLVPLDPCGATAAQKLIHDAEVHFQHCPRNVLNCKAP